MRSSINSEEKGSLAFYLILFVVLGFAVMLAGGGSSLLSGDVPSPVIEETEPSGSPSPTATPSGTWKISYTPQGCTNESINGAKGKAKFEGPNPSEFQISVEQNGSYVIKHESRFSESGKEFNVLLSSTDGFSTNPWKIEIVSDGNILSTFNGAPTGCN